MTCPTVFKNFFSSCSPPSATANPQGPGPSTAPPSTLNHRYVTTSQRHATYIKYANNVAFILMSLSLISLCGVLVGFALDHLDPWACYLTTGIVVFFMIIACLFNYWHKQTKNLLQNTSSNV